MFSPFFNCFAFLNNFTSWRWDQSLYLALIYSLMFCVVTSRHIMWAYTRLFILLLRSCFAPDQGSKSQCRNWCRWHVWSWQYLITVSTQHSATVFPSTTSFILLSIIRQKGRCCCPTCSCHANTIKAWQEEQTGDGETGRSGWGSSSRKRCINIGTPRCWWTGESLFVCMQFFCFVCSCCCQASFVDCRLFAQHKVSMLLLSYIKIYCHFILYSLIYATHSSTTLLTHMTCRMMRMIIPTKMAQNPTGNLKMLCHRSQCMVTYTCMEIFRRGSKTSKHRSYHSCMWECKISIKQIMKISILKSKILKISKEVFPFLVLRCAVPTMNSRMFFFSFCCLFIRENVKMG